VNEQRRAEQRVRRLVEAARRIADPGDALGREARRVLPAATGLSAEGVELALGRSLETEPSDAEIEALLASVPAAPRAHVLLSANVFVAAHRAVALALAASSTVEVRPSRREPSMVRLLARGAPDLFRVVEELEPAPGDHFWAYGSDETMTAIGRSLPHGVCFHAHGGGIGAVALDLRATSDERVAELAAAVADDVVLFDQRGCLSPRVVVVVGSEAVTRGFAAALAAALAALSVRVPRGLLGRAEAADAVRYRDAIRFAAELLAAGPGWVGVDVHAGPVVVAPVGRHVHVMRAEDASVALSPLRRAMAALAIDGDPDWARVIRQEFAGARISPPGRMQRPPFDGAVDRRTPAVIT